MLGVTDLIDSKLLEVSIQRFYVKEEPFSNNAPVIKTPPCPPNRKQLPCICSTETAKAH